MIPAQQSHGRSYSVPIDGPLQCNHIGVHAARGAARTLAAGIYRDLQKTTHNLESTRMSHDSASTVDNKNPCLLESKFWDKRPRISLRHP